MHITQYSPCHSDLTSSQSRDRGGDVGKNPFEDTPSPSATERSKKTSVRAPAAKTATELSKKNDSTPMQICVEILHSGDAPVPSAETEHSKYALVQAHAFSTSDQLIKILLFVMPRSPN